MIRTCATVDRVNVIIIVCEPAPCHNIIGAPVSSTTTTWQQSTRPGVDSFVDNKSCIATDISALTKPRRFCSHDSRLGAARFTLFAAPSAALGTLVYGAELCVMCSESFLSENSKLSEQGFLVVFSLFYLSVLRVFSPWFVTSPSIRTRVSVYTVVNI